MVPSSSIDSSYIHSTSIWKTLNSLSNPKIPPKIEGRDSAMNYFKQHDRQNSSFGFTGEEHLPDAASEKELGNENFKQKKYREAIRCYSRSIALGSTAVAYANRAMAYLKIKRFRDAEIDCTEALGLDDRYVKAYSRRAMARKELAKLPDALEDCEFAMQLEPHNQEIKKQHAEIKSLYRKKMHSDSSSSIEASPNGRAEAKSGSNVRVEEVIVKNATTIRSKNASSAVRGEREMVERERGGGVDASVRALALRAASRMKDETMRNIRAPNSAYEFDVTWRALCEDRDSQARFLRMIPPPTLPDIFKHSLTTSVVVDIIRCVTTFFIQETETAIDYMEGLTRVSRFHLIIMSLNPAEKEGMRQMWGGLFSHEALPIEHADRIDRLRSFYCLS